jgi:hypothetical protein
MEQIKIEDESGDKKYFTILPHFVLNHSTANDQSIYWQLKRIAGENGKCSVGYRYLQKQTGLGHKAIKKAIKYLVDHKWIEYLGLFNYKTDGGIQKVNTYKIIDIWKLNIKNYQGVLESDPLDNQGVLESNLRCAQKETKVCASEHERITTKEITPEVRDDTPSQKNKEFFTNKEKQLEVINYLISNGISDVIAKCEVDKFISYWTELNKSGTKQRWELEATFELKRRFSTWFSRIKDFKISNKTKITKL